MNAVGIDVSKEKSMVSVLRPLGVTLSEPFEVGHDATYLLALAKRIRSYDGETRVVMEHTGRYYESIAKVLHDCGLFICAVNPLLIKEYGETRFARSKPQG